MAGVNVPQGRRDDGTSQILTMGGMAAGAIAGGGPSGAATGASLGNTIGGFASKQTSEVPATAMDRRAAMLQQSSANLDALRKADIAVAQLPPQQQAQYRAIPMARKMAESEVV